MINPFPYLYNLIINFWHALSSFWQQNNSVLSIFFLFFYFMLLLTPILYIIDTLTSVIFRIFQALFLTIAIIINWFKNLFKPKIFYLIKNNHKMVFQVSKEKRNKLIYLYSEEMENPINNQPSKLNNEINNRPPQLNNEKEGN